MKKYSYNTETYEKLSRWKMTQPIAIVMLFVGVFLIKNSLEINKVKKEYIYFFVFITIAIGVLVSVFNYVRMYRITNNLINCYLAIGDGGISGYAFDRIELNSNGKYCEILFENIRDIRIQYSTCESIFDLYNSNSFYNFVVDCTDGSYKFCLNDPSGIKKEIERQMEVKALVNGEVDLSRFSVSNASFPRGLCWVCEKNTDVSEVTIKNGISPKRVKVCRECIDKYINK